MRLSDAQSLYTGKLLKRLRELPADGQEIAGWYWLRGIYWEWQDEKENAAVDFRSAIGHLPGNVSTSGSESAANPCWDYQFDAAERRFLSKGFSPVADAYLRLGRILAKLDITKCKRECLRPSEKTAALASRSVPAVLYSDWGDAFRRRYEAALDEADDLERMKYTLKKREIALKKDPVRNQNGLVEISRLLMKNQSALDRIGIHANAYFELACSRYNDSQRVNPTWSRACLGAGELFLAKAKRSKPDCISIREQIAEASDEFDRAVTIDPSSSGAYCGRADGLRLLALADMAEDAARRLAILERAEQSADVARRTRRNRNPKSLESLALCLERSGRFSMARATSSEQRPRSCESTERSLRIRISEANEKYSQAKAEDASSEQRFSKRARPLQLCGGSLQ